MNFISRHFTFCRVVFVAKLVNSRVTHVTPNLALAVCIAFKLASNGIRPTDLYVLLNETNPEALINLHVD